MALLEVLSNLTEQLVQPLQLLLVDDSPEFLESAARFLSLEPCIKIIDTAQSGFEAIKKAALLQPDIVVMDINMPGMSGLEATKQIKRQPNTPSLIIIVTLHDNPEYRDAAGIAGADGYISKAEFGTALVPLIRKLCGSSSQ